MVGTKRVAVYIDGSNTYNKLKRLGVPGEGMTFDINAFVTHLVGERTLISKRYYVGIVKNHDGTAKSESLVRRQQKYLESLRASGFDVKPGTIMYDHNRIREKGVDVKLSVDLVIGAADNLYDVAIVVSSDTDLIPAIKYARQWKKKTVEYVGFAGAPSFGMINESDLQRMFALEDLKKFQQTKI